jgi:hypothetical protein
VTSWSFASSGGGGSGRDSFTPPGYGLAGLVHAVRRA